MQAPSWGAWGPQWVQGQSEQPAGWGAGGQAGYSQQQWHQQHNALAAGYAGAPSPAQPPAKRPRLEPDQTALFAAARGGGSVPRQPKAHGSKQQRRVENAAAAAAVESLPAVPAGDYLAAYPAVGHLMARFK